MDRPVLRLLAIAGLVLLIVVGGFVAITRAAAVSGGTQEASLMVGGRERTFRVHVPPSVAPTGGFPLLIVLHGGGGNGRYIERTSGFSALADEKGFIAVYPDGTGQLGRRFTWDAHNCCGYAFRQSVDDVGFISALIDHLVAEYHADPTRIYITGHSNGAMMTYRIGCELAGKIAAIAPVAGALNTDSCAPSRPLPVLILHGADDEHVPIAGGVSTVRVSAMTGRVDQPLSHAVDAWATIDRCDPVPTVTTTQSETVSIYSGCAAGTEVKAVVITGWGHTWPKVSDGAPLDASPLIWDFVSQFSYEPAAG